MINIDNRASGKTVSYTASATPALEMNQVRKIAEAVNPVITDGFALYEKTKNFYLHLAGSYSWDYRPLFDEQAQEIFDSMDVLAKQLRQIGVATVSSLAHPNELQSVESYHRDFLSPGKMMEQLATDNQRILVSIRIADKVCKTLHEMTLGSILQIMLDQTEKRIRFLSEAKTRI